jgi:AMP nucleosidase
MIFKKPILEEVFQNDIFPETAVICHSPEEAFNVLGDFYAQGVEHLKASIKKGSIYKDLQDPEFQGVYPYVGCLVSEENLNSCSTSAYGAALEVGLYGGTITKPRLFGDYYKEQLSLLMKHHQCPLLVAKSRSLIPIPFISDELFSDTSGEKSFTMPAMTDMLCRVNDDIVNGTYQEEWGLKPIAPFTAERVDYSLNRLYHYSGTHPEHFQRFILLTNYQRYVGWFLDYAKEQICHPGVGQAGQEGYVELVGPGDCRLDKNSSWDEELEKMAQHWSGLQMPTYHLKKPCGNGITFINIGVGPSNAKNITDHLAVLRPHCWLMLGHCAGLRSTQVLGDYVLAHGYVRDDGVLDSDLPLWIPVPPIAEIQQALQESIERVTGLKREQLRSRVRTGTVISTGNRNWELRTKELNVSLNLSRAIALDMESSTVAANGFRFRVPYGTLLCVSDKPLHGELKLRGMARKFYHERVEQHLQVGLETIRILQKNSLHLIHSRKLRGFKEAPFR